MNAVTIRDEQPDDCGCFRSDDQSDALQALDRGLAPTMGLVHAPAFGTL